MELKYGSSLQQGRYIIEKVLGQGGFGITYLACQTGLNRKVAVKEFFMQEYCNRDAGTSMVSVPSMGSRELVERYRQKFLKEARLIASFDNNNIIRIYDVFEDNGTAYYVMEYLEGKNLKAVLEECGPLPEDLALKYIRQISLALAEVHASNLLHLDVKPANIMLNKKGEAVLIDFGISKHYDEGGKQTSSALAGTSEGYAPLEQYEAGALDSFTPATDIYALGATLFCLLAGMRPPKASEVMNHGLPELPQDISPAVREAVTAAMQPMVRMRPQSVEEFLSLLESTDNREQITDNKEDGKELIDDADIEVTVVPEYREQRIENRVQSAKAKTIEVENEETLAVEKKIEQPTIKNKEPIAPKNNRTALVVATVVLLSGVIGYFLAQGGYDDSKLPRKENVSAARDLVEDVVSSTTSRPNATLEEYVDDETANYPVPKQVASKYVFMDKNGNDVFHKKFDDAERFSACGLALVKIGDKYGYIDINGETVIACKYDKAESFVNDQAIVERDGNVYIIDVDGKETLQGVAEPDASTIQSIVVGVSAIATPADGKIPVEVHSDGKIDKPNEQGAGQGSENPTTGGNGETGTTLTETGVVNEVGEDGNPVQ